MIQSTQPIVYVIWHQPSAGVTLHKRIINFCGSESETLEYFNTYLLPESCYGDYYEVYCAVEDEIDYLDPARSLFLAWEVTRRSPKQIPLDD